MEQDILKLQNLLSLKRLLYLDSFFRIPQRESEKLSTKTLVVGRPRPKKCYSANWKGNNSQVEFHPKLTLIFPMVIST